MDWTGTVHLGAALLALVSGLLVILAPKGTRAHRWNGRVYVVSMVALLATAFMIYDLFGGFGAFHVAAIASAVTVVGGMVPAWRRRPPRFWIVRHAYWMTGSYVGLVAAAASETATRTFDVPMGPTVALTSAAVCVVGVALMLRRVPTTLSRFGLGPEPPSRRSPSPPHARAGREP